MPSGAWVPAIRQDGEDRDGADVCDLTSLDLSGWPEGTRAICPRDEAASWCPTQLHRYQWLSLPGLHHRPGRSRYRAPGSSPTGAFRYGKDAGMRSCRFTGSPRMRSGSRWLSPPRIFWRGRRNSVSPGRPPALGAQACPVSAVAHLWSPRTERAPPHSPAAELMAVGERTSQRLPPTASTALSALTELRSSMASSGFTASCSCLRNARLPHSAPCLARR